MHHEAIAGFLGALTLAHAIVAGYCLAVLWRRRDRDLLVFGLLNVALVAFDGALAGAYSGAFAAARALVAAETWRVVASALLVHHVLRYARTAASRRVLVALYGAALFFALAVAGGFAFRFAEAGVRPSWVLGVPVDQVMAPPTRLGVALSFAHAAAALACVVALGRALLRGRREEVAFAGLTLLAVAVVTDALVSAGWASGPPLSAPGFAAFSASVVVTVLTRYSTLRLQLEGRATELKRRSRELALQYDELRAAQSELVRKEQLAAIGELSAVVAHEVRNPLAIISNAVATLRRRGVEPEDRETLLGILDEEASRLNRLVGDLLRYARPVNLERQLLDLRELVERARGLVSQAPDLEIVMVQPEPLDRLWGDPNLLRQVVENLMTNAVQAMAGGPGTLTLTLVPLAFEGVAGLELRIQDTGEGMDTQVRNRALDPFFTTRPSGTGLGLAIVSRIVDAHGGKLRIKSAAGAGTIVHVFLPISDGAQPLTAPAEHPSLPPLPEELRRALVDPGS